MAKTLYTQDDLLVGFGTVPAGTKVSEIDPPLSDDEVKVLEEAGKIGPDRPSETITVARALEDASSEELAAEVVSRLAGGDTRLFAAIENAADAADVTVPEPGTETDPAEKYESQDKAELVKEAEKRSLDVKRGDGDTDKDPVKADYVAALVADDAAASA
jgi:uncharacterized radical SAM superfamily protein